MSAVSVREFCYNPSAVFTRVEQGETVEVTRYGRVIAVMVHGFASLGRYSDLVARGVLRLKTTTDDLARLPRYEIPGDTSPLEVLLAELEEDER